MTRSDAPSPRSGPAPPRLEFRDVTRRFGRHEALHTTDLRIEAGQRVVLAGPNGAGKTTLLRLAAGLLRPTSGTVLADGRAPTDAHGRRGISFLSQDVPVYAELTVREHVAWWTRLHGAPLPPARVDGWLDGAGLRRLAQERASVLSRGQRQRLAIAMALATQPTLLLLDEPTTALDAAGRAWLQGLLEDRDAAMVVASHEPLAWLGARRLVMDAGRVRGDASMPDTTPDLHLPRPVADAPGGEAA